MVFITGGKENGKMEYALRRYFGGRLPEDSACGSTAFAEDLTGASLITDLHEYIRRHQKDGHCALPELRPDAVVICDEVGSGVISMEKDERDFREAVGRAGCRIAALADRVEVVRFGIPQRIK